MQQPDHADVPRPLDVGPAAELPGVLPDLDHAHGVPVLLAEEHHGAEPLRLLHRGLEDARGVVPREAAVGDQLRLLQLIGGDGRRMREVEAQTAGLHERPRLASVLAQELSERRVHDVGGGVGSRGRLAAVGVDLRMGLLARPDLARSDHAGVDDGSVARGDRVGHPDDTGGRADQPPVADLSSPLRVERGAVEEDANLLPLLGRGQLAELGVQQRHDRSVGLEVVVADEGRRRGRARVEADRHLLRGGAGAAPLLLEQLREPVAVDGQPRLRGELLGELQGEPEGVGELEGVLAGDPALLGPGLRIFEEHQSLAQRGREPLLLGSRHLPDERLVLPQLGVGVAESIHDDVDDRIHHGALDAQTPRVRHDAAKHPAQDVPPPTVRGLHTVRDQERGGAAVLGDHLQGDVVGRIAAVGLPGHRFGDLEDRPEQIGLEDVLHALEEHRHSLERRAGVDVLRRERPGDLERSRRPGPG